MYEGRARPAPLQSLSVAASDDTTRVQLLGAPRVVRGPHALDLPSSAPGLLIAYLAARGDWLAREAVAVLFWPEASEADAQHHLRVTLHRARQWLERAGLGKQLLAERRRLRLDVGCDVNAFRRAIAQADWAAALAQYRGPLLQGVAVRGFAALDDWLHREREDLAAEWKAASLREAQRLESAGVAGAAATLLLEQLRSDLLAEDALQALLRVAPMAGERAAALDLYERFSRRLHSELGLQPMAQTVGLAERLHAQPGASAPAAGLAQPPRPASAGLPPLLLDPPLLGRDAELAALVSQRARLNVLAGEPGVGKTRLVQAAAPGALWWRCKEGLQGVPLLPVAQWLDRDAARIVQELDDAATLRELARLAPMLLPGEVLAPAEASSSSPRLLLALARAVTRCTDLLVIDDLQWLDDTTLQLLQVLFAPGASSPPPRLICTLRPHQAPASVMQWIEREQSAGHAHQVQLAPWGADATAGFVERLMRRPAPRLAARLHQASGGNPFFAIETLRAWALRGGFEAMADAAADPPVSAQGEPALPLGERVAAMIQMRVQAQPESAQRVLNAAAAFGTAPPVALLAPMCGLTPWASAQALAQLESEGLLAGPSFTHDLVREALLQRLPPPLLRALHAGIVQHGRKHLPSHALAQHAWSAGDEDQAVEHTVAAAVDDRNRGLHHQALGLLDATLARCRLAANRAVLQGQLAVLHEQLGRLDEALQYAEQAVAGPAPLQARLEALCVQAGVAHTRGEIARSAQLAEEGLALDPGAQSLVMHMAQLAYSQGNFARAEELLAGLWERARRKTPSTDHTSILMSRGIIATALGQHARAVALLEQALALSRRLGARHEEVSSARNLVMALAEAGRTDEAVPVGEAALTLGEYGATPMLLNNLAAIYLRLDRNAEARALCERLAAGPDALLRCLSQAKIVRIDAQLGHIERIGDDIERLFAAMAQTEHYQAHAVAVIAVLDHGAPEHLPRALAALRPQPLDASTTQRLDAALSRHGLTRPVAATAAPTP